MRNPLATILLVSGILADAATLPAAATKTGDGRLPASIKPSDKRLEFRVRAKDAEMTLAPFNSFLAKRYAVYWKLTPNEKK